MRSHANSRGLPAAAARRPVIRTDRSPTPDPIHVRSYKEEGTITTPSDMTVLSDLDRFHLAMAAIDRLPQTRGQGLAFKRRLDDTRLEHQRYIRKNGRDMPEVRDWQWPAAG
ncbi:MAG: hypothetical protein ABIN96_11700 [Rubrivivax sp.]